MGAIDYISEVIMGIGIVMIIWQLTGYATSNLGVFGYLVSGAIFAFGLFLNLRFSKKKNRNSRNIIE
jgi:hypothetical protein